MSGAETYRNLSQVFDMNGSVVAFIDCNTNSFVNELSEELTFYEVPDSG